MFIDGQPAFFGCHLIGSMDVNNLAADQPYIQKYADAGVHIYSVDILNQAWVGPRPGNNSPYDWSQVVPHLQTYLEVDPQAIFLLRMGFETRYLPWWGQAYPDECEILSDGSRQGHSFASTIWRNGVKELLKEFIAYLKSVGMYERVAAFQIGTGSCGEWIKTESSMTRPTMDYSRPMQQHFRAWLRQRYQNEVGQLRRAWDNAHVDFDSARVPSFEQQTTTTTGHSFRDPQRERQVIDYYQCFAELCADDLLDFCHTVREATHGEKLVGAFYGYLMELAWNLCFFASPSTIQESAISTIQRSGHLGLHQALHSPDIDFFVSPYSYEFRGLGGDGLPMQPGEALRLHGKIYFMEEDTLMHNNFDPGGRNQSVAHSIAVYQRNFTQALTHAQGITWFETRDLHEAASLVEERPEWIRRFQALGQWALQLHRQPAAEVAVFLDDESFYYESLQNNLDIPLIWRQRVTSLNRFGAAHDVYLLNDLLEHDLPPYKLYIFLNAFHLDNRRREALKSVLRRDGRTALWLFAPGYLNSEATPPAHIDHLTDLTGIQFGQGDSPWGTLMHLTNFRHPITQGLPQDWFWGATSPIGPIFHLEDPEVIELGQVVYSLGRCKPGFGVKSFHAADPARAWHSIFLSSPDIPAPVLRGIARFAGVHLYSEAGDVLYATPDLLSVHTIAGGLRQFQLPRRVEVVYDLFNQTVLGKDVNEFRVTLPEASTSLFYTGKANLLKNHPGC